MAPTRTLMTGTVLMTAIGDWGDIAVPERPA